MVETDFGNNGDSMFPDTSKESIELTRNNKGVYAWKIKLKDEKLTATTISMLDALNEKMEDKYGSKGD